MTTTLLEQPELSSVLVGRQAQRDLLVQRMEQALEGQGAVVMVAGQAGVGKTRLLAEVEPEAGACGLVFLRGAADPVRSGLAYGLFIGVLRGYLQQVAPPQQRALRKAIEELAPHLRHALFPRARRRLVSSVGQVDPEVCQTLFLARLARLLLELAGQGPVVVCLEDLHWADSASLQALGYLARRTGSAPLLVVGTYRPEALDEPGRPAGLAAVLQGLEQAPHYHGVELEGLSEVETRLLVSSCFSGSGFGNELLSTLYERTGGGASFYCAVSGIAARQGGGIRTAGAVAGPAAARLGGACVHPCGHAGAPGGSAG